MNADKLQAKVYAGYGKAAQRIGPLCQLYRPLSPTAPLANQLAPLYASFNAEDFSYMRPNKYAKPTWFCVADGRLLAVGDYLVDPLGKTWFIAALQTILPILAVDCNRTISMRRPQRQTGNGRLGYNGDTAANETILMSGWPASVLQGTKGEKSETNLPGDTRSPWWTVLLPAWPGVVLRSADIITDDLERRYVISSAELTDLGWRITAAQAQT